MWLYKGREVTDEDVEGYVAFVYKITNLTNNKHYIGKKNLQTLRRKKVKGKINRRRVVKSSDWKNYWGSNSILKEDVASIGKENFRKEILHFCRTKGTANYLELKEQIIQNALEREDFYNEWIHVKVHKSQIKI